MGVLVLLVAIALGALPRLPKAESKHAIRLRIRVESGLIHEPTLFFQDGHGLFIDSVGEFSRFSWFAGEFDYGQFKCAKLRLVGLLVNCPQLGQQLFRAAVVTYRGLVKYSAIPTLLRLYKRGRACHLARSKGN